MGKDIIKCECAAGTEQLRKSTRTHVGETEVASTLTLEVASQLYAPIRMHRFVYFQWIPMDLLCINDTSIKLTFEKKTGREDNWLDFSTLPLPLNHVSSSLCAVLSPHHVHTGETSAPSAQARFPQPKLLQFLKPPI